MAEMQVQLRQRRVGRQCAAIKASAWRSSTDPTPMAKIVPGGATTDRMAF
jgi:hypothetical protein